MSQKKTKILISVVFKNLIKNFNEEIIIYNNSIRIKKMTHENQL